MSIDNIPSNYNGLGYGDYTNPTQTYIDYSVNEINGPCAFQRYSVNGIAGYTGTTGAVSPGTPLGTVLPNGSTKYSVFKVLDGPYILSYDDLLTHLYETGFNKDGQVITITNSIESNNRMGFAFNIGVTGGAPPVVLGGIESILEKAPLLQAFIGNVPTGTYEIPFPPGLSTTLTYISTDSGKPAIYITSIG
jgi:hypothetical protein